MIQRIQTVYLSIAFIIAGVLTNFIPFFVIEENINMFLVNTLSNDSVLLKSVGIFTILSAILSLVAIFSYKKRQNQFVVNRLNVLINFYLLGVLIYLSLTLPGEMKISEKGILIYFPIVIIVLLVMANKAIKKDEDLVKSVDRLR
ncbi:DUF4293 domain-containing protein [Wenyingzhuangia sp. 2_MG-2023]|uniref:DUF4293 domain-containing protein n=1 Tax=Wenyingzhuangia sp. 2_MG-2023 TaxID=3062639 RepID=UPI0026E295A9|nr:DUF4293 domain-containing protein [Wenyingzhuangia sp. 2_MG-2023]MDO6738854.1 DUF4293 domain-containing protein [Wenyingzhuangia sp. 2_MG-2023]MDO6803596.1 DUF4293 domain-containing protein [Wenyingzhuangia sp. 1_MG-2023]